MKIQENVLIVIKAVLPFFIVVILFIIIGQFGFGKISELRDQITKAQDDQKVLIQKLDILRNIEANGTQYSNLAASALSDTSPALTVVSQIKLLASTQGVILSEIKAGSPATDATGFSTVNVSFNVIGSRNQVEDFTKRISSFAPITIVDKIKITETSPGSALGALVVKSYWAPFPTKVPAVTQAIIDLTPAEQQILQGLGSLMQPVFSQIVPSQGGGKTNPFSP